MLYSLAEIKSKEGKFKTSAITAARRFLPSVMPDGNKDNFIALYAEKCTRPVKAESNACSGVVSEDIDDGTIGTLDLDDDDDDEFDLTVTDLKLISDEHVTAIP